MDGGEKPPSFGRAKIGNSASPLKTGARGARTRRTNSTMPMQIRIAARDLLREQLCALRLSPPAVEGTEQTVPR